MERLLIVSILLVIFANCTKEKQTLLENVWKVQEMKQHTDSIWQSMYTAVDLSFVNKDKYVFQSSSGCRIGRVKIEKTTNYINFEDGISGPSFVSLQEANTFRLLTDVKQYEIISGDKLVLTGNNGEIIKLGKKIIF